MYTIIEMKNADSTKPNYFVVYNRIKKVEVARFDTFIEAQKYRLLIS